MLEVEKELEMVEAGIVVLKIVLPVEKEFEDEAELIMVLSVRKVVDDERSMELNEFEPVCAISLNLINIYTCLLYYFIWKTLYF